MKRTRAGARAARPLVEWKDGVHVVGTPLWCDTRRTREACFVSHAAVPEARRHRQIIATDATIQLLPRGTERAAPLELAAPYGRPFSLGAVRLELFPSGYMVGAASLAVDTGAARVVYAGPVRPAGGGLAGAAEARACDALVVDGSLAHPRYRFPPLAEVRRDVASWVDESLADGATPVLLAHPLATAPELAALLGHHPLVAHRTIADATRVLRGLGHALPPLRRLQGAPSPGQVVLWPVGARDARALGAIRRARLALISGWAADAAVVARSRVDAAFAWPEQASHAELVEYIAQSGAREIYLTGGGPDLARALGARLLGPPTQLPLF